MKKTQTPTKEISNAGSILIPFVVNKGQFEDPNVLYYSSTFACTVAVNKDGTIDYGLMHHKTGRAEQPLIIREIVDRTLKTSPQGERKAVTRVSHFNGRDPKKWITDIPTFNTVDMGEIHKGVRLKLQARDNNVEKIFHVSPGTDPKEIRLRIDGAQKLKLSPQGELEIHTRAGLMRFSKPVAYQQTCGRKTPVDVAYTIKGESYGFQVATYDTTKSLVIDPLITAIFVGTTDTRTKPTCMAADNDGNVYVAGKSAGQNAVFKFDKNLEELQSAALFARKSYQNTNVDIFDIAIDRQGAVYLVGGTHDPNFPVTEDALDTEITNGYYGMIEDEGFVIKYNADLNTILASTFLGAKEDDVVFGLALDPNNNVYVAGMTTNLNSGSSEGDRFPVTPGAYDTNHGHGSKTKAFVALLDSELKHVMAATLLGYNADLEDNDYHLDDRAYHVAIDADGNIVVAGKTQSEHFPVTDACADARFQGGGEAFVAKFDSGLQNLLASTFLGGANKEHINALAIDANNSILVAGWTQSSDFHVAQDNFDTGYNLYEDGFVTKLNSALTTIEASTFIGGDGTEQVSDMVIHPDGRVLLCGGTGSSNFPVTDKAYDTSFDGALTDDFFKGDGFYAVMDGSLTRLAYSTFLGGSSSDHASAIAINKDDIVLAGETTSENFPYVKDLKGDSDAFVCRFNDTEISDPEPSAGPGHWQSKENGTAKRIYLDINICDDGSFTGIWQGYFCIVVCKIREDRLGPNPVSGSIDFKTKTGTITFDDDCKDIPIVVDKQNKNDFHITIKPGGASSSCLGEFRSELHYQGEPKANACDDIIIEPGGEGDGGGGGCIIDALQP